MINFYRLITCLLISVLIITLAATAAAGEVKIVIPGQVNVQDHQIILNRIAAFTGIKTEKLNIDLGRAPLPGNQRHISRNLIKLYLKNNGIDLENIKLVMPEMIVIETASRVITPTKISNFARDYIMSKIETASGQITVRVISNLNPVTIPDRNYSIQVGRFAGNKLMGRVSLPVEIRAGGEVLQRIYVGLEIKLVEKVYIATRDISRGEKIKSEDFRPVTMSLNSIENLVLDLEQPVVKEGVCRYPLQKGEVLTYNHLQQPVLISWGNQVQADVIIGNVRVSTVVRALENGKKDDYIMVENTDTGYKFKARVVDANHVRVYRGG